MDWLAMAAGAWDSHRRANAVKGLEAQDATERDHLAWANANAMRDGLRMADPARETALTILLGQSPAARRETQ